MSDAAMRRRRRHGAHFRAPWGRAVKMATGASGLILVTLTTIPQLALSGKDGAWWVRLLAPAVVVGLFGVVALFSVRGFTIQGHDLLIQRSFWKTRLPLGDLKTAHADPGAMKGSLRMAGNGGFLAFTGWFRSKHLGRYRAFVTDQDRCVVMVFKERTIVVSPDDPAGFVNALGFESDPPRAKH